MFLAEAKLEYEKALHLGKKDGGSLEVLDDILIEKDIRVPKEVSLGSVQIPIDQIAGTKTEGRNSSFSKHFYPTLGVDTEFAHKWINLCASHLEEGIRDPVKAYEFMNKFYIVEGNKRVSVLKYFDAPLVAGQVIRIIPPYAEDKETKIYYEFMDFYNLSSINFVLFSKEGSYQKLQKLVGKHPTQTWTKDEQRKFSTLFYRFKDCLGRLGISEKELNPADAFLYFIGLYSYEELKTDTYSAFVDKVEQLQNEFKLLSSDDAVQLHMEPEESRKKSILRRLISTGTPNLTVSFVHEKSAETSGWTYSHELGRTGIENTFPGQVITNHYDNTTADHALDVLEEAIAQGSNLIFTTSPVLSKASVKAALAHPEVKILNCSLNATHKSVRTYYARMYEVKFLLGLIAGAMTQNDKIGYLVEYPIYGTASINAFSIGAKMTNPRAKVYLLDERIAKEDETFFMKNDISIVCDKDIAPMGVFDQHFGLYQTTTDSLWNMAMPVWQWSKFYEQIIRNIMNGGWKLDDITTENSGLNYWWGLSTGVVDFIYSRRLPAETLKLVQFFKSSIANGTFSPFSGILHTQKGILSPDAKEGLSPQEITSMDWLCDNVIGTVSKASDWNRGEIV